MLLVDVRDLNRGPVETEGRLDADDPTFAGLDLDLEGPVTVSGKLSRTGDQEYFWHARVQGRFKGACRRCLTDLSYPLDADVEVLFSANPENADDPAVYPLPAPVTRVDVRPAVREEVALAVSAFPLCKEDCAGLCPRCGADLNAGPCACGAAGRT
ncbi:MAG TPA: DUF177 domain-containing protein [Gemmatimonadales bacterium]|nr:DUF177 domain-containing protein [Gemmatimonadales bacterium]